MRTHGNTRTCRCNTRSHLARGLADWRAEYLHGPYTYLSPRPSGRGRLRYVPSELVAAVRAQLHRGEQVETVLAQISAINLELLSRREPG